jgi:hypothetical protein
MALNTKGYPYPLGTDPISSGDDIIKSLADAVAAKQGTQVVTGQTAPIALTSAVSANLGVTFPVSIFTNVPRVTAGVSGATTKVYAIAQGITAGGFTATIVSNGGVAQSNPGVTVDWIAILF